VDARIRTELTGFIVMNYFFGDTARVLRDDDSLVEEGIVDSTGILELIEFIESHFGIDVSETETVPENLGSISSLTKFVANKLSVGEPALGKVADDREVSPQHERLSAGGGFAGRCGAGGFW
jgi:acyl carrier protein